VARATLGLWVLALAVLVAGCDGGASQRRKLEGQQAPTWPALQAFQGEGGFVTVGMGIDREGPQSAKKAAAAASFKQLLDNLDKEPIPSSFATAAREAAKKDVVDSLRKLAEAGSDDEIKKLWEKAKASMQTLTSP